MRNTREIIHVLKIRDHCVTHHSVLLCTYWTFIISDIVLSVIQTGHSLTSLIASSPTITLTSRCHHLVLLCTIVHTELSSLVIIVLSVIQTGRSLITVAASLIASSPTMTLTLVSSVMKPIFLVASPDHCFELPLPWSFFLSVPVKMNK